MNKLLIFAVLATLTSCGSFGTRTTNTQAETQANVVADMHTAENSLDYLGTYGGTIPAADCPGIIVKLVLNSDNSYNLNMEYIDRNSVHTQEGVFEVSGNELTLKPSIEGQSGGSYKIGENMLFMLDGDRKVIEGPLAENYILKKEAN